MIYHIEGILRQNQPSYVVLDASGVGYKLFVSSTTAGQLPAIGQRCLLYTAHIIREAAQSLYGFLSEQERDFFELLLDAKGVGPKIALNICSHLGLRQALQAIRDGEVKLLCQVPGVGKKGAQQLILDLRNKLAQFSFIGDAVSPSSGVKQTAIAALVTLGYDSSHAIAAIEQLLDKEQAEPPLTLLISQALAVLKPK